MVSVDARAPGMSIDAEVILFVLVTRPVLVTMKVYNYPAVALMAPKFVTPR